MALNHLLPADPVDIQPLGERLATEPTKALFKSEQLELIRLVLRAGKSFPPHQVPGEVTIHCIEGEIHVTTESGSNILKAGQLLYLKGGAPHGVVALQDASALVTIVLKP